MKRTFSLLLIAILSLTLFGCSASHNEKEGSSGDGKIKSNEKKESSDGDKIKDNESEKIDGVLIKTLSTETAEIIIYNARTENNDITKIITNEEEIEKIIRTLSRAGEAHNITTSEGYNWIFEMYDIESKLISTISIRTSDGHIGFDDGKRYLLTLQDIRILEAIINN